MPKIVLLVQATKPAQVAQLQAQYPDWTFKTVAELMPTDYDQIEVMYGNPSDFEANFGEPDESLTFLTSHFRRG